VKRWRRGDPATGPRTAPAIDIDIEELVLEGFPNGERFRIAGAVEKELTQLFRAQGPPALWAKGGDFARLDCVAFKMNAGQREGTIGAQIARSIYGGRPR